MNSDGELPADLTTAELHGALEDPALNSMNFLNEVANHYPEAISLAAGRPCEEFFDLDGLHQYLRTFCRYLSDDLGYDDAQVRRTVFQYGRTKGIIHQLIATNLELDEGIVADPESIVVTGRCSWCCGRCVRTNATCCSRCRRPMSG